MTFTTTDFSPAPFSDIDLSVWSDAYKDAFGSRPRGGFPKTEAEYTASMALMQKVITREEDERIEAEKLAWARWKARLRQQRQDWAQPVCTLMRWEMDANQLQRGDHDDYCYLEGLGFAKAPVIAWLVERARFLKSHQ